MTEYGDLRVDQARRLKPPETENGRLKRVVAELTFNDHIVKKEAEGIFGAPPVAAFAANKSDHFWG